MSARVGNEIEPPDVSSSLEEGKTREQGAAGRSLSFSRAYKIPRRHQQEFTTAQTLLLAYQSLGVVYGDLGTSPLYVFPSVALPDLGEKDILGAMSLIFWTLTLVGLVKYVLIVLHADDHGEGGTFAIYSLLRQHINFKSKSIVQSTQLESDMDLLFHSDGSAVRTKTKHFLEESKGAQTVMTFMVLLGTCMVIGDGALTPSISVLSAVQGIQSSSSKITQEHVVLLCVAILVILFLIQRFGTSRISASFSPIMLVWFSSNATIGLYNIIKYYPGVLKSLSPHYIYLFFDRNHKRGWELLGTAVLCITGSEAMFADLGHFNKRGIQIAFSFVVYPVLIVAYAGEAAYLIENPNNINTAFYSSVPSPLFWPMFVIATLAAIVASQSLISASFSIVRQSMALGCFPIVTMVHTSPKHEGQVYSPEVNYFLMIVSILITISFKGGPDIGNAYGVAVIWVMIITTLLMVVVMLVIWDTNVILVSIFVIVFLGMEGTYMTSLMNKVPQGGWVPFTISVFFLSITLSWTYGRSKKASYEAERKMNAAELNQLITANNVVRVPGVCFFCTDLINGIPPIVQHYMQHVGALREIMVMVTVRTVPVRSVLLEERCLAAQLSPKGIYRCLVQYGYMDVPDMGGEEFLNSVIEALKDKAGGPAEVEALESALNRDIVFVVGRTILKTSPKSGWFEHLVIDNLYRFLQRNSRPAVVSMRAPPGKVLQVGMLYEIE